MKRRKKEESPTKHHCTHTHTHTLTQKVLWAVFFFTPTNTHTHKIGRGKVGGNFKISNKYLRLIFQCYVLRGF